MSKGLFISIKPKYTKRIENGEKNYEFRNYVPKEDFDKLYVYESSPTCSLKYILTIDRITKYPDKILEKGYGNEDFNKGLKKSRYAYHISKVEKLKEPIELKVLRKDYDFNAPQSFAYDKRYPSLSEYLNKISCDIILQRK